MKKYLFISFLFCICLDQSFGQSKFKLEMYTGPQYSYLKMINDPTPSLNFESILANHIGLGLLYSLEKDWQLSLQSEFTGVAFNYDGFVNFPVQKFRTFEVRGGNLWHHRLGLRKSWEKGKHAFYLQPSVGVSLQRYAEYIDRDSTSSFQFFNYKTSVVANASIDAGVKFYTKSKNYFIVGLRHQQGLGLLRGREFNWMGNNPNPRVQDRGSYTGLVLGYGIDFKGKQQDEREEWKAGRVDRKRERREAAWRDGAYLMATGILRFRPKSERELGLEFSHISGGNQFLAGYTFGSLSVESGYARLNSNTNVAIDGGMLNIHTPTDYTVGVIPVRLRYHWDIGNQNRLRVGASGAALYTLDTRGSIWYSRVSGSQSGQTQYDLTAIPVEQNSASNVFFNAGVFAEIPVFNSSMFTFDFSRNFGSPDVGRVAISGEVNSQPVNFDAIGTLNGWVMEFGYKLPLNRIFKK